MRTSAKKNNKNEVPVALLEPPRASQPAVKLSMALQYIPSLTGRDT